MQRGANRRIAVLERELSVDTLDLGDVGVQKSYNHSVTTYLRNLAMRTGSLPARRVRCNIILIFV